MRTRTKQGGREGHNEASPNLNYSTSPSCVVGGLLVTTGRLIYDREQGGKESSRVTERGGLH